MFRQVRGHRMILVSTVLPGWWAEEPNCNGLRSEEVRKWDQYEPTPEMNSYG